MNKTRFLLLLTAVLGACTTAPAWDSPAAATAATRNAPRVQVALLLDTSGSMQGLIAQAKTRLWQIVNEVAKARKDGQAPLLELALYEYGNDGLAASQGWVRQVVPFTRDLNLVSEKLFALTTNGGSEHCGEVLRHALRDLAWTDGTGVLRLAFIAGNEPFTQGPVDYRPVCIEARTRGILVNTIHCGGREEGIAGQWLDGAALGGGSYFAIDSNRVVVVATAPQDQELARLGLALNSTYLPYGALGMEGQQRQVTQDNNAQGSGAWVYSERQAYKANPRAYDNASWDLVDAVRNGKASVDHMPDRDLPEALRKVSVAERKARIAAMDAERARIQARIHMLSAERERWLQAREQAQAAAAGVGAGAGADTLDRAILDTIRKQAGAAGFTFAK